MDLLDLPTPALVIDLEALNFNIDKMAAVRPGPALRSHVKAFKSTELARHLAQRSGSDTFCCATIREMVGMARAGLGRDLLLANESVDLIRLSALAETGAETDSRITIAIDSPETLAAAVHAQKHGPIEVLIDVNIGLPRCGIAPEYAGRLADAARNAGLPVRGVMGYEGHIVGNPDREWRTSELEVSIALLKAAHADVGGDVTSSGGTGTYDLHTWASEIQAGSFALMDTSYAQLNLGFRQAVTVLATIISTNPAKGYAVADAGLKSFGMDHGDPSLPGHTVFFASDEHLTIITGEAGPLAVDDRVRLDPAHVDPTMSQHERAYVVSGTEVVDTWAIDLRNW